MFDSFDSLKNILLIDENRLTSSNVSRLMGTAYRCDVVESIAGALVRLRQTDYSVVLCSASVPDAIDEIPVLRAHAPQSAVVLMGDGHTADEAVAAFRAGVFEFLLGPLEFAALESAVKRGIEHYETACLKNQYQIHLEQLASERAAEIDKALNEVENSYRITLKALVQALETRDFETHGHSERVVTFSLRLGYELGLDKEALRDLELGALLHDIGKIGVPDSILRKPAKLNDDEWAKMKLHPVHGQKILRNISFLEGAAQVVGQHHERWDGAGYPYGIRGEEIDIGARIFAVVDAFDAMVSDRVYRKGRPYELALEELERCSGTQFDPLVVEAFKSIPREDWELLRARSLNDKNEVHSFQSVVADLVFTADHHEFVH